MIFIDTSFFLALLDVRDSLNPCARSWANSLREKLVVTEYVLWETINAASSPLKRPSVHALID
jgi:predicted nucleic acid-binding protein